MSSVEPAHLPGGFRAAVRLLRGNRDFRRVYLASVISLGGDWFLIVALFGLVLDLTGSSLAVGLVIAAQDFAYFFAAPYMGYLADRLDRRTLMIVADVGRVVLVLGFLLVRSSDTVWVAFALLAGMAALASLFEPASAAALPNLVEPEELGIANALSGSLWGTMLAVGASLGGIVTALAGREAAIAIDAVSFLVSALLIAGVRRPLTRERAEHVGVRSATIETARFARRDHRVLSLIAVKFGWGLSGGVLALIPIVSRSYGGGDIGLGLLMASRGVGALLGPFAGRAIVGNEDRRLFGTITVAQGVFGMGYALLGIAPGLAFAIPSLAIAHVGGSAQWTLSSFGLQRIVPDRIRGRIFSFDGMLVTFTFGLSSLVTGWLAGVIGAAETAYLMGALSVAWAALWTWMSTGARRSPLGLEPDPAAV